MVSRARQTGAEGCLAIGADNCDRVRHSVPASRTAAQQTLRTAAPEQATGLRRVAYVVLAAICLALGLLGAVLPGLPTTPFLLLMSFLLVRSSPWLHQQVLRLPIVGRHLREWDEHRGVRRSVKIVAYASVGIAVGLVLVATALSGYFKLLVLAVALVGVSVIYRLPTIQQRNLPDSKR